MLAFSGLRAVHRQRLRESGVPLQLAFLQAAPSVLAARLAERRDHFMPPALLASQLDALQMPTDEPDVLLVDAERPLAEVVALISAAFG